VASNETKVCVTLDERSEPVPEMIKQTQIYSSLNETRQSFASRSLESDGALAGTARTASASQYGL